LRLCAFARGIGPYMNILHTIPYLGKAQGGPVESLRLLASAQAQMGNRVRVIHTGIPADGDDAVLPSDVDVLLVGSRGPTRWAPRLGDAACSGGVNPDVIHSHVLWLDAGRQAARLSKRVGVPLVVSPCGMLQVGARQVSRWKKRIAWFGFQRRVLLSAGAIHAKSDDEAVGIKDQLPEAKVVVIPNPVEPPPAVEAKDGEADTPSAFRTAGIDPRHKVVLFLGRIHPVKGLDRLLEAWSSVHRGFPDWRLAIIGPDQDGHRAKLESSIGELAALGNGMNDFPSSLAFMGPVYGEARWEAYRRAQLLVAPSDFENFGQSIVEALSVGIPVITTTGTPWQALVEKACGWWVDPSPGSIAQALQEAMGLTDAERASMGQNGKKLAERYHPDRIAQEMCRFYTSLL